MSTNHKDFLISNLIIVVFTLILVLALNFFILSNFSFNQQTFYPITIILVLLGVSIYYFLTKSLLKDLFKSEERLKGILKETLHELNTPVATIGLNTKILRKKIDDEKMIQRLDRIDNACDDLLELYDQMEYGIKEHINHISFESFNITEIIEKSISKFKDIKGEITIEYDKKPLQLYGDKSGFLKMIDNLISNGIKYNKPDGTIKISLNDNILKIEDSGIGIDTKNLFSVFDKYYQESSLSTGVGLGLNIVKKYCDENKIEIKIDSKKDIGTIFYLDLSSIREKYGS